MSDQKPDIAVVHIRGKKHDKLVKPTTVKMGHGIHPYRIQWKNTNSSDAVIQIDEDDWKETFCEPYPGDIAVADDNSSPVYDLLRAGKRDDQKFTYQITVGKTIVANLEIDTKKN